MICLPVYLCVHIYIYIYIYWYWYVYIYILQRMVVPSIDNTLQGTFIPKSRTCLTLQYITGQYSYIHYYIHTTHITCTLQLQYDHNYNYIDITITITTSVHYIHRYVTCVCVCLCGFVCLLAHLHECWRLEYLLNACFCEWVCWLLLPGAIAVLYNHATVGSSDHLNWDSMCQWAPSSPLKSLWKSSKPGTASGPTTRHGFGHVNFFGSREHSWGSKLADGGNSAGSEREPQRRQHIIRSTHSEIRDVVTWSTTNSISNRAIFAPRHWVISNWRNLCNYKENCTSTSTQFQYIYIDRW